MERGVIATAINDENTKFIIGGLNLAAGSTNEVEIVNGVDYAENKLSSIKKSFTVVVDTRTTSI